MPVSGQSLFLLHLRKSSSLLGLDLFYKQIKHGDDYGAKNDASVETITHLGMSDSSPANCLRFCFLSVNWAGSWVLVSSGNLATTLAFPISPPLPQLYWLGITKNKFYEIPRNLKCQWLLFGHSSCLLCGPLRKLTERPVASETFKLQKMLHLETFWLAQTEFIIAPTITLCFHRNTSY